MKKYSATLYYSNELDYDSTPFFTENEILEITNEYRSDDGLDEFDSFNDDAWNYLESETDFGVVHCTEQYFNEDEIDYYNGEYSAELYYSSELDVDNIPFFTQRELIVEANARRAQEGLPETNDFGEAYDYLESPDFGVIRSSTQYFNEDDVEIVKDSNNATIN